MYEHFEPSEAKKTEFSKLLEHDNIMFCDRNMDHYT